MRIAIVDDDPIVCQSLETILTATGAADVLWTANDGDDAVGRYFAAPGTRPDILLIDIQMPGRDGLDAAREILEHDPAARILFLTTFADRAYITRAMALGAKGYLIKQDVTAVGPALQAVMAGQVVLGSDVLGKLTGGGDTTASTPPSHRHGSSGGQENPDEAGSCSADAAAMESMLNEREREVAALVAEGLDNRDIAKRLHFSEGTVRNRVSGALDKLGLTNRTQLAILWINTHR
ncbi:response regulator transcription factor [Bifidobacterium parmae]|nr:response regulator transcription factor [Bifidobacterium parmae]